MFKQFKSFYYKDRYDFSKGLVDPFDFHKIFYRMSITFKVADLKNPNPPSLFNQNAVLFIVGSIAIILSLFSFYHGLVTFDIPHITEAGSYTLLLTYELFILYCTRRNLPQFHNLMRALQNDFLYICTAGKKYRAPYFENQLRTWKICIIIIILNITLQIAMNIFSCGVFFYFLATHGASEGSRPLLFPFWMPNVDFSKSPVYEIVFVYCNIGIIVYSYTYTFMIITHIVWISQITSKVDVIIWKIQDLLVDIHPATTKEESEYFSHLIKTRMKEIVAHHQSMYSLMEDYAKVYKKLLFFEHIIASPVICLTAFCIAQKFDQGEFNAILVVICFATIVLHFMPSYMCTYLNTKVNSISDACWGIPFWNAGPVIRPYMVLIMQRSLQPLPLKVGGFNVVSLETFSQTMTNAYSWFNMLRQTDL